MARPPRGLIRAAATAAAALLLAGCQLGYFGHLARGQMAVLEARQPIDALVADADIDPELRRRLAMVAEARRFAVTALALPDSDSYRSFVRLERDYVLWNVFAAPAFSLEPHRWCYLFYGCFAYRGYYDEALAEGEAERLAETGLDVHVGGVPAYSTLGWFDDPLLWSMLYWDDDTLLATVFHELAHERFYLAGDTAFNESFATFVGSEGLRRWAAARGVDAPDTSAGRQRRERFVGLIQETRDELGALYAQDDLPADTMRRRKAAIIAALRARYRALREGPWADFAGYDRWFAEPINNAKLLPVGLYHRWVPAFRRLFEAADGDWPAFYRTVKALGALPSDARADVLDALLSREAD